MPKTPPNTRLLSKITANFDGTNEKKIWDRLSQVKEATEYFVPVYQLCKPPPASAKEALITCKDTAEGLEDETVSSLVMLTVPHGGTVLQMIPFHRILSQYIPLMTHLLEAGTLLLIQGICHYDIHWNNILVSDQLRLIDYGGSWIASEIDAQNVRSNGRQFSPKTGHESLEMTYWNGIKDTDLKMSQEDLIRVLFTQKPCFAVMDSVYGIDRQALENQFRRFLQNSQAMQSKQSLQFYRSYWTKFDAWSIGWIMIRYLKEGLFDPKFTKETYQPHKRVFLRTIQGLLHMDPAHRLDAAEALEIFAPQSSLLKKDGVREWLAKQKQVRARLSAYESLPESYGVSHGGYT